ncbi:hypothetical protein DFQ26_004884 [Actinomortierella ambigua]|nr:hypothetical protein DFQ26_004884 [Actinomortierella ambigua]
MPALQPRPLIAEIEQLKRSVDSMNTQTADILKHLDHLRQIGVDHIALPSTEQEKLDREWEYFETVCDQVYFILENARYKMERQRMVLQGQLNKPIPIKGEVAETEVVAGPSFPTTTQQSEADAGPTQTPSAPITYGELTKATPQDEVHSGDIQMLSPPANLTPTSIAASTNVSNSSPIGSIAVSNPGASDRVQTASPLPQTTTITPLTIATSSSSSSSSAAVISPASILQSTSELPPALLTVDGSMGMDNSLLTDLDKFQDSMLDLGDIGNLGDMDGMGGMGDMVDF